MGIRKKLKTKICEYLLKKGIFTSKKTDTNKILRFLNMVRPKSLDIENIRIGGDNEGGYIVPNDFQGVKYCFSPGVGSSSKFENEITKKNIKCFLADYSVNPKFKNNLIDFEKKFIGTSSYENFLNLSDWIENKIDYENNNDLLLQMDIEGDEYEVINSLNDKLLRKFRIVLIEFHQLHYLFDDFIFEKINKAFEKITKLFNCTHIHPNNDVDFVFKDKDIIIPPVLEFSFLRKDRGNIMNKDLFFPSKLDQPNVLNKKDIKLPRCWYKSVGQII